MSYLYRNSDGRQFLMPAAGEIVDNLINEAESGCIHFADGLQMALSFLDGVPVVQFNRKPERIAPVILKLGVAFQVRQVCHKNEFERIVVRAVRSPQLISIG